ERCRSARANQRMGAVHSTWPRSSFARRMRAPRRTFPVLVLATSLWLTAAAAAATPEPTAPPADAEQEESTEGRSQKYPGWAVLYHVPEPTIVYTSPPGEQGQTHRCSA